MEAKARAFFWFVAAVAAGLFLGAALLHSDPIPGEVVRGWLVFVFIGIIAEVLATDFAAGRQAKSSLAFLPFLASIHLFSPILALLNVAIVLLASCLMRRQSLDKAAFNIGAGVIAAAAASFASSISLGFPEPFADVVRFTFLAAAFFLSNILLASCALSLIKNNDFFDTFRSVIGSRGSNLLYDIFASPLAWIMGMIYTTSDLLVLLFILPLMLLRRSYQAKLQLEEANRDLLTALVTAIETRDPYTKGHSHRVRLLSGMIAEAIELHGVKRSNLEMASLLHDIGKIDAAYITILEKPHSLTAAEVDIIRTHATRGADLLQNLATVPPEVVAAVRHHHERYDGLGYPAGLHGKAIPLASRVIMLADSIDAMLSDRPYRRALTPAQVEAEITKHSGTQFDPEIVEAMKRYGLLGRALNIVDNRWNSIDEEIFQVVGLAR
jgi:putative nucleotidyltransferase with HDIG domain